MRIESEAKTREVRKTIQKNWQKFTMSLGNIHAQMDMPWFREALICEGFNNDDIRKLKQAVNDFYAKATEIENRKLRLH